MRSFLVVSVLIAGALAVCAMPASAAESARDAFARNLSKRAGDGTYKRGLCVCMGGAQNGRAGEIEMGSLASGTSEYLYERCNSPTFDRNTGDYASSVLCDATWVPLPR